MVAYRESGRVRVLVLEEGGRRRREEGRRERVCEVYSIRNEKMHDDLTTFQKYKPGMFVPLWLLFRGSSFVGFPYLKSVWERTELAHLT